MTTMTNRSITRDTFVVERTFPHSPERVFRAFSEQAQKAKWFGDPRTTGGVWEFDFREGGHELNSGQWEGVLNEFDSIYHDIVPGERIVFSYVMRVGGVKLSASLATLEFTAVEGGTRYTHTETGAYFDGHEDPALRQEGTNQVADALGASLDD